MASIPNSFPSSQHLNNYSLPNDLLMEKKANPKASILKKKTPRNTFEFQNILAEGEKTKHNIAFVDPIQKTYPVENWKEYNVDASKEDDLCICSIY